MRKGLVIAVSTAMLLSSCGTYEGSGAYTGATLGSILGSAIGGLSDGPRGSDLGTLIGTVGGAAVGAAIGAKADQQRAEDLQQYQHDKAERAAARARRQQSYQPQENSGQQYNAQPQSNNNSTTDYSEEGKEQSGFDATNSGDDRIYDFSSSDYTGNYSAQKPSVTMPANSSVSRIAGHLTYSPAIEVRNARFVDDNENGTIERGELCKIIFEVMNQSNTTVRDVIPNVVETTGNRHIYISPSIHVEEIEPGKGIRYTAMVKADNRLGNGKVKFCVSVLQGNNEISKVSEFNIPTRK